MKPVLRRLLHSPMFTVITVITLAIGIGSNSAIFSVLNGVLLKPLPYPDSERLVAVWETSHLQGMPIINASPSTYFTFREENKTLQDIGVWQYGSANITGSGEPEQVQTLGMTDGVLPVLGVQPIRGRWFSRKDDLPGSPKTVVLAYSYWQRKFGGDRAAAHSGWRGSRNYRRDAGQIPVHEQPVGPDHTAAARPRQDFHREF